MIFMTMANMQTKRQKFVLKIQINFFYAIFISTDDVGPESVSYKIYNREETNHLHGNFQHFRQNELHLNHIMFTFIFYFYRSVTWLKTIPSLYQILYIINSLKVNFSLCFWSAYFQSLAIYR